MAVRLRMKKMGRTHRPFFRICATDSRAPRDGRVIEELGYYDPMCKETDARAILKSERIDYWLGVGAQPSDNVRVLIKKYGTDGTHLEKQQQALERLKVRPQAPEPVTISPPAKEAPAEDAPKAEAEATEAEAPTPETPTPEAAASDEAKGAEAKADEASAEETDKPEESAS